MIKVAVSLYNGRLRILDRMPEDKLKHGDYVIYETQDGLWCNRIFVLPTRLALEREAMETAHFIRVATDRDIEQRKEQEDREHQAYVKCKQKIARHGLPMKLATAIYTFDYRRVTFFFSANGRVDFRELLQDLTRTFPRTRIMLRQIGLRNETGLLGGVGSCGQELCCSRFINQFETITIQMAEDQDLPPNPARLSGNCGRLKCCLKYEQDYYLFMKERMPAIGQHIQVGDIQGKVSQHLVLQNSVQLYTGRKFVTLSMADIKANS